MWGFMTDIRKHLLIVEAKKNIKRKDYAGTKEQRIDGWIDKLLDENFNYFLLADIQHCNMILGNKFLKSFKKRICRIP